MKTIIHVNQHNIRANLKGAELPVITCKNYKSNTYANEVIIYDKYGEECARVVYAPNSPLSCGARVWIETNNKIQANENVRTRETDASSGPDRQASVC